MADSAPSSILVVDNDEQSTDHIASGLKDNGYLVITAPNGYDGYVRTLNESPSIVIANDLLPYVSGYKLAKLIKSDDRHKDIIIIIMSTSSGQTIEKLYSQSGADSFLEKPFQLKDVIDLIKTHTRNG